MTPPATAVLSPITTLCAIWHWLSMITPLPIIVSSSAPRSMVVQAPISTRSPIITRPICGSSPSYHDRWHNQSRLRLPLFRTGSGNSDRSGSHGKWLRSPRDANLHRFCCFTYEATGTDNHVIAQFNAGLNHRVSANRYVVTQLRRRVNHRTGCNVSARAAAWYLKFAPCARKSGRDSSLPARHFSRKEDRPGS